MGTAAAVAVLMRKEREIVASYRAAAATSPDRGRTPGELDVHEGVAFDRLRRRAVLRPALNGGLYLDEPTWEVLRSFRRRMAVVMCVVVVLAAVAAASLTLPARPLLIATTSADSSSYGARTVSSPSDRAVGSSARRAHGWSVRGSRVFAPRRQQPASRC